MCGRGTRYEGVRNAAKGACARCLRCYSTDAAHDRVLAPGKITEFTQTRPSERSMRYWSPTGPYTGCADVCSESAKPCKMHNFIPREMVLITFSGTFVAAAPRCLSPHKNPSATVPKDCLAMDKHQYPRIARSMWRMQPQSRAPASIYTHA